MQFQLIRITVNPYFFIENVPLLLTPQIPGYVTPELNVKPEEGLPMETVPQDSVFVAGLSSLLPELFRTYHQNF